MSNVFAFDSIITNGKGKKQAGISGNLKGNVSGRSEKAQPPHTKRGAVNTYRDGMKALFDWVSVTFKTLEIDDLISVLGLKKDDFTDLEKGGLGYRRRMVDGNISIFYDGTSDMGIHLQMTGQGCREYEGKKDFKGWDVLFACLYDLEGKFTRVDVAIDEFAGYFKIETLARKAKRGEVASRFRTATSYEKISLKNGEDLGRTLNFGSRSSRVMVRMYDKKKEQLGKGKEVKEKHWNRFELEIKQESANKFVKEYLLGEKSIGDLASGLLRHYIRFLKPDNDSNKSRWKTWMAWEKFLGGVEAVRVAIEAKVKTIDEKINWLEKSIAPSLGAVIEAEGEGILLAIAKEGRGRIKPELRLAIESHKNTVSMPRWKERLFSRLTTKELFSI